MMTKNLMNDFCMLGFIVPKGNTGLFLKKNYQSEYSGLETGKMGSENDAYQNIDNRRNH